MQHYLCEKGTCDQIKNLNEMQQFGQTWQQPGATAEDFAEYVKLSDSLFPNLFRLQRTVVVLRPSVVRLGLCDVIASFFSQKNFVVLRRSTAALTDYESAILSKIEGLPATQLERYKDLMQETHVEALLLTKYGAIPDAMQLCFQDETGILAGTEKVGSPEQTLTFRSAPGAAEEIAWAEQKKAPDTKTAVPSTKARRELVDPAKSLNHLVEAEIGKSRRMQARLNTVVLAVSIYARDGANRRGTT